MTLGSDKWRVFFFFFKILPVLMTKRNDETKPECPFGFYAKDAKVQRSLIRGAGGGGGGFYEVFSKDLQRMSLVFVDS